MLVVTDRGADLSPQQLADLDIHFAPLTLTLDGRTYVSGVDIQPDEFYKLLAASQGMPSTSLPSLGDFVTLYRALAKHDQEILSVHISSGLSGTYQTALAAAQMAPEARITVCDSGTLSAAQGWQVEAAARAARAGWPVERIVALLAKIKSATNLVFTLPDLKYLIHGGRISHLKGLVASILDLKPLIAVSKQNGTYYQRGQARTFGRATAQLLDVIAQDHPRGARLRVQVMHTNNPQGAEQLRQMIGDRLTCAWLPSLPVAPVLGAHTGPGVLGIVYAAQDVFSELP